LSNQNKVGAPSKLGLGGVFSSFQKITMWGRAPSPVQAERKLGKKHAIKLRVPPDLNCGRIGQRRLASDGYASKVVPVYAHMYVVVCVCFDALP
jgi:hypothetical protein